MTGQISSRTQLTRDLRRRFGPSDYWNAEVALNKLSQTAGVAAYISAFEDLSTSTPGLTTQNLLCRFLAGLKEDIHREIILLRPETLEEAMGMARVAEDKINATKGSYLRPTGSRPFTNPGSGELNRARPFNSPATGGPGRPEVHRPSPSGIPIRRLTPSEIAARREKGLCINCDERYTPGHRCKAKFLCLMMEEHEEENEAEDREVEDDCIKGDPAQTEEIPNITFHAMQGKVAPSTLRLEASIKGRTITVLIDSGSTHNFLQNRLARHFKMAVEPATHMNVTVGNGEEMRCEGVCRQVPITLGDESYQVDLHLLPIFGADVVLGAQWLSEIGLATFCYKELWMSFKKNGNTVKL